MRFTCHDDRSHAEADRSNVESALMAHLGMRVSHKKISVATSDDPHRPLRGTPTPVYTPAVPDALRSDPDTNSDGTPVTVRSREDGFYFEDVEVRRSRTKGVACRVTLRKGEETYIGESEGMENERIRIELAARAAGGDPSGRGWRAVLALEGCKLVDASSGISVFVGVTIRRVREHVGDGQCGDSGERGDGECAGGVDAEPLARTVMVRLRS